MIIIILLITLFIIVGFPLFIASHAYKFKKEANNFTPAKYGFKFEEITIPTENNLNLYGWWIPAENPKKEKLPIILLVHGWTRNVDRMMSYIKKLHPAGYNLIAFDSRCHGRSDDDKFSSLRHFTEDILATIKYAKSNFLIDENRIGLLGLSMGGAASIYASSLNKNVKAVVTIGAFSHPEKVMGVQFKKNKIPYFPFVWIAFRYMEFRIERKFDKIAPENNIAKSDAKFFIIHGISDETAPIEHAQELYDSSKKENTMLWRVEGKGHSDCNHHPEFWPKVLKFYNENL